METTLQAMLVIAIVAAAHERFIEALRGALADSSVQFVRNLVAAITVGPWSFLLGIAMAIVTNANLLALFQPAGAGQAAGSAFYAQYLHPWPDGVQAVFGCVLMGLCAALGSRFWHDLAYGLIDLRNTATSLPSTVTQTLAPPKAPPSDFVSRG